MEAFKLLKSPEEDCIFPTALQRALETIPGFLRSVITGSKKYTNSMEVAKSSHHSESG